MQIEPQYTLPLVYELTDPFDSDTYYVRAVIRDSISREIIDTKNLTKTSDGVYTSSILAPKDPTGLGRHIDIVISVYTDSLYTQYSEKYQKKIDKYLVVKRNQNFGGTSGISIDYEKISKIIDNKLIELETKLRQKPLDLTPFVSAIKKHINDAINSLEMPEFKEIEPVNLEPVISEIKELGKKVDSIDIPEPEEPVKLFPILDKMESFRENFETIKDTVSKTVTEVVKPLIEEMILDFIDSQRDSDEKKNERIKQILSVFGENMPENAPKNKKNELISKYLKQK